MAQGRFGARPMRGVGVNPTVLVLGAFFLVFAITGTLLVYLSFASKGNEQVTQQVQRSVVETVDVLIPIATIQEGSPLEPSMFTVQSRPKSGVSAKVVSSFEAIRGMYAQTLIVAESPLHQDFITPVKPNSEITAKIPPGFRAVTIRVDATTSVEGWARPGARVDVLWITKEDTGQPMATVIVENAKILSTERSTKSENQNQEQSVAPSTVTLLVVSEDATKINLASTSGRLSLMLRGDQDGDSGPIGSVITASDIIQGGKNDALKNALKSGVVKVRKPNGEMEEFVLNEEQSLVPLSSLRGAK
jgi:pilus assembly protein CpaB